MCGITGIINFEEENHVSRDTVLKMTRTLIHRGPDSEGLLVDGNYGLGFRRLSIIDLSPNGNQPMVNEDGSIFLLCNGEIYNYQDLKKELKRCGHQFRSNADSEVPLHAYEEYGDNFVQHLNGMFGMAILDLKKKKLLLFRDRLGIKPLYYKVDSQGIHFGSELKSILADTSVEREIDPLALNLFFTREVIPAPYTIYKGIRKLQNGECLIADLEKGESGVRVQKYWNPYFNPDRDKSEESFCEDLLDLLNDAIRIHMISDVPIGAFLSGGIDSSSVVALMSQNSSSPVETFTVRFNEQEADESSVAREVARHCRTSHHELTVDTDSLSILDNLIQHYDEPFGGSSAIPTYLISKKAREYVKVVLSGDGGDELFGGYFLPHTVRKIEAAAKFPDFLRPLIPCLSKVIPKRYASGIRKLGLPKWMMFASMHSHIFDDLWANVLNKDWRVSRDDILSTYDHLKRHVTGKEPLNDCMAIYFQTYLPDMIQTKVDRASSAHSLETRVPLLDYRIVELVGTIPPELKFQGNYQRYIFRKIMRPFLPDAVFSHPKQGFSVPIEKWGQTIWRKRLCEIRRDEPWIEDFIDFSNEARWTGALVWHVLFLSRWLVLNS